MAVWAGDAAPFGTILCRGTLSLPVAGLGGNKGIDTFAALFWVILCVYGRGWNELTL